MFCYYVNHYTLFTSFVKHFLLLLKQQLGSRSGIRTHDFTVLQTVAVVHSAIPLLFLVLPTGFEPVTLSNLETMPVISGVFYR